MTPQPPAADLAVQRTVPAGARAWPSAARLGAGVGAQGTAAEHTLGPVLQGRPGGVVPQAQASGVLQRVVDQEAFGPGRSEQRRIGSHKQGWWHPAPVHPAPYRQRAGQLHGIVGP